MPWYNAHSAQRPLLSSDRLPNLHLPQSYASNPASGTPPRVGSFDSGSNYSNSYTPSLTSASSYPGADSGTGLKTPSPSEGSPNVSSHVPKDTAAPYSSQAEGAQIYAQESDPYTAMNQPQQYIDSQHSHISTSPSYAAQPQTTSGMSHYSQYAQQAPSLGNAPGSYGQTQPYSQYYGSGVTSPQSAGQPVTTSMVSQLLPLPGTCRGIEEVSRSDRERLTCSSNGHHGASTTSLWWSGRSRPSLSSAKFRFDGSDSPPWR